MAETISSRTPEGEPNACPVCEAVITIEPSSPFGDAPCPTCGTLLWFVNTGQGLRLFDAELVERVRQRLIESIGESIGTNDTAEILAFLKSTDSLDFDEIVVELEEDEGTGFSDSEREQVSEIIEWFLRQSREQE